MPCHHRCTHAPLGGGHCLVVFGGGARNVRAPRGLVVIGALVGGPVNDVAALGRASGRTRRAHVPSGGGRCLVGGGARVRTPRGALRGLVVVGALVRSSDDDVAALGRASGRTRRAYAPSCGGRCLIIVGGSARVPTPRGALRGLVVVGALVEGPVVDISAPGRASVVACCKSDDGTTKARRYRFGKQSDRKKLTLYLELEKIQVDGGRNYYPTNFKFVSLALLSKKP